MIQPQTFILPGMIDYDAEEYSYHNQVLELIQAKKKLDQQVMFGEIFKIFATEKELISFNLVLSCVINNNNKYDNEIFFQKVKSNKDINLEVESHLFTTINYLTNNNQISVLEWAIKVAEKNNIEHFYTEDSNKTKLFMLHMDNISVDIFAREAYGEAYPSFFKQYLDKTLQSFPQTKTSRKKI